MATKPSSYLNWTNGSPPSVAKPPDDQLASGWVAGEPPPCEYMNWLLWTTDQWIQYLDQVGAEGEMVNPMALANARLIGGGTWSFDATSNAFSWSSGFNIAIPGADDASNAAAAGSVALADGRVAYVIANIPFVTTGDVSNSSSQITNVNYNQGIAVGQVIGGAHIPDGTTVIGISGSTVTMSAAATGTASSQPLAFCANTALTVSTALESSLVPTAGLLVLARRVGNVLAVGINAGEILLRDKEQKLLRAVGYSVVIQALAGQNLTAGQVAYISPGSSLGDGGRTAGRAYPCDTSTANGSVRGNPAGIVVSSVSSGATAQIVQSGLVPLFSGLLPGLVYFADPATPGGVTATQPSTAGQWLAPIGEALTATEIAVNTGQGARTVLSGGSQGNYGVFTEAQLSAALSGCSASGGGVIIIEAPFTCVSNQIIPANTLIIGQLDAALLTLSNCTFTAAQGVRFREISFIGTTNGQVVLSLRDNAAIVEKCRFLPTSGRSVTCVQVTGSMNRLLFNTFVGCAAGVPTGINYAGGTDNSDDSSIFA